jgi:phosphinothricin acetyltransferase
MAPVQIDSLRPDDWPAVCAIYLEGIHGRNATFETEAPNWERWDASHHAHSRVVARDADRVLGWAALRAVSERKVYAGVAEVSVYVDSHAHRRGIGHALLTALIESSERNGIWTLNAGIFPENVASVKLHLRCGFREVGRRERIAKLDGRWRDVLLLERRSKVIGL